MSRDYGWIHSLLEEAAQGRTSAHARRMGMASNLEVDLRKDARRLENGLDAKLVQFARLDGGCDEVGGAQSGLDATAGSALQREIEHMLLQLSEVNDQMSRQAASASGSVATTRHVLQRHREILHDFMQEFNKTKANLKSADERQQLLSTVRQDICDHRSTASAGQQRQDTLLRERNAIHSSDRLASDVIAQAEATKASLGAQRSVFGGVGSKLQSISALAPQVNALIGAIQRRKRRDKMILGVLIGCCISFLLLYSA